MGDFFKGWRRKTGLALLVLALLLTVAWGRSHILRDVISISTSTQSLHVLFSIKGGVMWKRVYFQTPDVGSPSGLDIDWDSQDASMFSDWDDANRDINTGWIVWRWHWGDFFVGVESNEEPTGNVKEWLISYSILVLPLTLLSAWLILGKPRTANRHLPTSDPR